MYKHIKKVKIQSSRAEEVRSDLISLYMGIFLIDDQSNYQGFNR
jgi:hypothetical protein